MKHARTWNSLARVAAETEEQLLQESSNGMRSDGLRASPINRAMKRILTLDGGGIRGVFTLQILSRIEALFREKYQRPHLVLADVFDLFAGTSTGAIIATFLCWGKSVAEIERLYIDHSPEMFSAARWSRKWKAKYNSEAIAEFFQNHFREDHGAPGAARDAKAQ